MFRARWWSAGLIVATIAAWAVPVPAKAAAAATVEASQGGTLWLRPNPDLLARLGVKPDATLEGREQWALSLLPLRPLLVELGDGAPTRVVDGEVVASGLRLRRRDGAMSPALRLVPDGGKRLDFNLVDADGRTWLRIAHAMRSPDRARDGLRLVTADLRVGPALAAWTDPTADDHLFANASMQLPLESAPALFARDKAMQKSCAAPNWPGTPGYVTDVSLVNLDRVDYLRCRAVDLSGACDGPGGLEGEVVFVPSATLRNRLSADAADVPWYTKFSGRFPPHGNDQHPFLVWNLYRLDAEGRIEQIAQSGLKHAFATANELCDDATCGFNGHILGRACQDLYNAGSNDVHSALSPRAEVIAARGIWGRCGSVHDDIVNFTGTPGCDGNQDSPPSDAYRHRMVARETTIDPALNVGATYLIDAWYLVRDDENIFNTMGSRSMQPNYLNGFWNPGLLGPFSNGPVIDRWLELAPEASESRRNDVESDEGRIGVAVRVTPLPGDLWRYDYAVMNFDFARVTTDPQTVEPNLRIVNNLGLSAVAVDLPNGAVVTASEFRDGDDSALNDWPGAPTPGAWRWSAPLASYLEWGRLMYFSVTSAASPQDGFITLEIAGGGSPASHAVPTLVPDLAAVFGNGFE